LATLSIKSKIDYVVTHLYDQSSEHSSFGRLNRLDCAIAIINLFIDQRWGESCYCFPAESLDILREQIEIVEFAIASDIVPRIKEEMAKLAVWNGYEILRTSVVINSTVSRE
jgi:hypothetical protein